MKSTGSQRHKIPGNAKEHKPIQTRILSELRELEQLEHLNPPADRDSRYQFLSNLDWIDSTVQPDPDAKQAVEDLVAEFQDIFARLGFDIGINTEFKVQLTPLDNRPAYSHSLPAPNNLKDDIFVELAIPHKYCIITTSQHYPLAETLVQYSHNGNQMRNYAY